MDVESERNDSFRQHLSDFEGSVVQSLEQCIRKALGILDKVTTDPVRFSSPSKAPTSEDKIEMLMQILE